MTKNLTKSALAKELESALAAARKRLAIGELLSNVAYNLAQRREPPSAAEWEDWRKRLDQLRREWDEVK